MRAVAYVDGSFSITKEGQGIYGSGIFIIVDGVDTPLEFSFGGTDEAWIKMRNVAGEIIACMSLVKFLQENLPQVDWLDLYYDYEGIEKWVTGEWRANKVETIAYKEIMREAQKNMRIKFYHVKAHSGVIYNERVDRLAKDAVEKVAGDLGQTL